MSILKAEVPRALAPLLKPARYKAAFGGRGGAKSHFFAEQCIIRCFARQTRFACIREIQNSLRESVRQLLIDKIQKFGLGDFFDVLESEIRGRNGSLIIFRGMQSFNAESIKSLEGFDVAWVEEAQSLSAHSLRLLRPTIRKEGSEIWFSWNPRHDTDAVDEFFRGAHKPADSIVCEINWDGNPWLPDVLRAEKDRDYAADRETADHVWGGGYQLVSEGSYYARLIARAESEGRVGSFPHTPQRPVRTAFDIGVDDYTAIWFVQEDGLQATVVDYYEVSGDGADDILATALPEIFTPPQEKRFQGWSRDKALAVLGREQPFRYDCHYLPHDVRMREWGHGARSRVETLISLGLKNIRKGVPAKPEDRIQAVRRILPLCRFNATPRVLLGLKRLRRFHRKWNDSLQTYTTPEHDENSHGCLVAGTPVETVRGMIPVEAVRAGDAVVLADGLTAPVEWAGYVKTCETIRVTLSDGRALELSPEHKIFTTRGVVRADALRYNDAIATRDNPLWDMHDLSKSSLGIRAAVSSFATGANTGFGKSAAYSSLKSAAGNAFSIAICGWGASAQYLKAWMLSRGMVTIRTYPPTIGILWDGTSAGSVLGSILFRYSTAESITSSRGKATTRPSTQTAESSCTEPCGCSIEGRSLTDTTSTTSTGTRPTTGLRTCNCSTARSTPECTPRKWCGLASFLRRAPKRLLWPLRGMARMLVLSGTASMARKRGARDSLSARSALSAGSDTRLTTRTDRSSAVAHARPARVVEVRRTGNVREVYDLTVPLHHCYHANGVLVSNSDAFGEFAVNCALTPPAPPKEKPKIETRQPTLAEIVARHDRMSGRSGSRI